jgi:hypothetical protein
MAKLKTFTQYVAEMDRSEEIEDDIVKAGEPEGKDIEELEDEAEEVQANEATVVLDATDPKSKTLAKLLKKHKVSMEVVDQDGPSGFPEVELTGARKDLEAVLASEDGWDDAGLNDYIEESNETFTVKVKALNEEDHEEAKEEKSIPVSEMLENCYANVQEEAGVWESDAHDDHTIETYMVENAALVATLAANALKEMKNESANEAYEAAINQMVESYTKKMSEMKESSNAPGAELED